MQYDAEGFSYPVGNLDNSTDCDVCNDICPAQSETNESFVKDNYLRNFVLPVGLKTKKLVESVPQAVFLVS